MQRCLEKGSRAQKLDLSDYIIENIHDLIEDPFGNYLIQNVLKLEDRDKNERIFKQIAKDFKREYTSESNEETTSQSEKNFTDIDFDDI